MTLKALIPPGGLQHPVPDTMPLIDTHVISKHLTASSTSHTYTVTAVIRVENREEALWLPIIHIDSCVRRVVVKVPAGFILLAQSKFRNFLVDKGAAECC